MPVPPDRADSVKHDADLMWLEGYKATSHKVCFGTTPRRLAALGSFSNNIVNPGPLAPDTVYYWRVDAVTPAGLVRGALWSFDTTVPPPAHREVGLAADPAKSTASAYGGSLDKTLNDPFLYDPDSPISPKPVVQFKPATGSLGFHADEPKGTDAVLAFSLPGGALTLAAGETFLVDLYGRDGYESRNQNLDVTLYHGAAVVASSAGHAIPEGNDHVRVKLSPTVPFDRVVVTGHPIGEAGNGFTLMEIRAAIHNGAPLD